jgi:hypothetical protein
MLMMGSGAMHVLFLYDWLLPEDLIIVRPHHFPALDGIAQCMIVSAAPHTLLFLQVPESWRGSVFESDWLYFLITVNPPILRCIRVATINVLVPVLAGVWPSAQANVLWFVYSVFSSHVDVAWHTLTSLLILTLHYKACLREFAHIAKSGEMLLQIQGGSMQIQGAVAETH